MTIQQKIRELLNKELSAGKKQIGLANEIGVSHSTIYKLLYTNTRPTTETLVKMANYFKVPLAELLEGERHDDKAESDREDLIRVPVVRKLPAEQLRDMVKEPATEYIWVKDVVENTFSMVAGDDAMAPLIRKGDYVLFREEESGAEGDVVVAVDQWESLLVRRLRKRDNELFLSPDNPEYSPITVTAKYRILGKASEVISRKRL